VFLTFISDSNHRSQDALQQENFPLPLFSFLLLLLTLGAIALDQLAAPILYSSSPLWATAAGMALIWRRGGSGAVGPEYPAGMRFSYVRVSLFVVAHLLLALLMRDLHDKILPVAGGVSAAGWITAALKLSVLLPTAFLLPMAQWRVLARAYKAEAIAALVVLFTFFPGRILTTIWPWYGQILGRLVFHFSSLFVHGLSYAKDLTPTIHGPDLDVTILLACSGINGIELFDYLFALMAVLDWNRLRKGRLLIAYFAGIAWMFIGNALRIACFVIFGNRGFAGIVTRFHLPAGWIFFSVVFLAYLSLTYRKLLVSTQ
jgi:exosortase/archaeosortase family protein